LRQLVDRVVALVEIGVRAVADGRQRPDLPIERGDLIDEGVRLGDVACALRDVRGLLLGDRGARRIERRCRLACDVEFAAALVTAVCSAE
jgi:hypothetical protein